MAAGKYFNFANHACNPVVWNRVYHLRLDNSITRLKKKRCTWHVKHTMLFAHGRHDPVHALHLYI
jgi:hypothetical protein